MIKKAYFFRLCYLFPLLLSPQAFASDWQASIETHTGDGYLFKIDLPDDLDLVELTQLAVELDGIDITATLGYDSGDFTYVPIEPLSAGTHIIKLVQINSDGSYNTKDEWQIDTGSSTAESNTALSAEQVSQAESWLRSSSFSSNNTLEVSQRIKQDSLSNQPRDFILSGAGETTGEWAGDNWQATARTNYFIQSEQALTLNGQSVDIGEYQLEAQRSGSINTGVKLGHHGLITQSLLASSHQRRGASVFVGLPDDRVSTQFFAMRPDNIVGNSHFTGLSESENRIEGFAATVKPFSNAHDATQVTALYYDGEGSSNGSGVSESGSSSEGSGWSVGVNKKLFDNKLNISGEYARAHYDADGSLGSLEEDKSDAYLVSLVSNPFSQLTLGGKPADLQIGFTHQRIDTFFASLANPGIAADKEASMLYSNFYWDRLSATIQLNHETNNVDDLEGLPTDRLRNANWNANYNFNQQTGSTAWLGTPYIQISGFTSKLDLKDTPQNYQGTDTDNATQTINFGGGSNYADWYWTASHSFTEFDDRTGDNNDNMNRLTSIGGGWQPSARLSLNSNLQYGVFVNDSDDSTTYSTNLNLGLQSQLIPEKLDLSLNYNLNLAGGDNDSPDRDLLNAELGWILKTATQNNPGISLSIRGALENYHGNNTQSYEDNYQVFAILRITAPFSSQR